MAEAARPPFSGLLSTSSSLRSKTANAAKALMDHPDQSSERPAPQPSTWGNLTIKTEDLCERICVSLAEGNTLRAICAEKDMPGLATVMRWLDSDAAFREQYARARERQADYFADEIIDISNTAVDRETALAAKVQIEARQWKAAVTAPKKYGLKPEGQQVHVQVAAISQERQEELRRRRLEAEKALSLEINPSSP
jgi:Bacteriophage Sf6, terminase small subunit-like